MPLNKLQRQLELMLLLTQNKQYTLDDLSKRLEMSTRTLYRYIELFREQGFIVTQRNGIFSLDKASPYFLRITQLVHFTEDEAITLRKILEGIPRKDQPIIHLIKKLARLYDFKVMEGIESDERYAENLQALYTAVKEGRIVQLLGYSSPHSRKCSDRLVEPFAFLSSNSEVRCLEIATQKNKTFKIARIKKVELTEVHWLHKELHKQVYTDIFQFSGEEQLKVKLRLNRLAQHLLLEECPSVKREQMVMEDDEHWLFQTQVCSYVGIGRFVLGLYTSIDVVDSPDFTHYLNEQLATMEQKSAGIAVHPSQQEVDTKVGD